MTFKKFAKKVDLSEEELIDVLTENGYLKKSGEPKAKFIEEGLFNDDGEIEDVNSLKDIIENLFSEDEDEDEDEEDEEVEVKSSKKSSKKSKDEDDDEDDDIEDDPEDESDDGDGEELEYSDMVDMLEDWEFESRDEVANLIKMLTDKLVELD